MSTDHVKTLADGELLARIGYLKSARHLGTWGERELSLAEAEATRRKFKRRDSAR